MSLNFPKIEYVINFPKITYGVAHEAEFADQVFLKIDPTAGHPEQGHLKIAYDAVDQAFIKGEFADQSFLKIDPTAGHPDQGHLKIADDAVDQAFIKGEFAGSSGVDQPHPEQSALNDLHQLLQ